MVDQPDTIIDRRILMVDRIRRAWRAAGVSLDPLGFDAIVVAAGAASMPVPLFEQMRSGGRRVMPIGPRQGDEQLILFSRAGASRIHRSLLGPVRFVLLLGSGARPESTGDPTDPLPLCYGAAITAVKLEDAQSAS